MSFGRYFSGNTLELRKGSFRTGIFDVDRKGRYDFFGSTLE